MIRIAIVEDDRHDREALKKCLNRYEKENQVKFSVTEFQDGEDIVTDYTASYDLIILDIEMAFLNGMKAAEKIRELDTNVIIIFITNMPQYAIHFLFFIFREYGKGSGKGEDTGEGVHYHCSEGR